MKHIYIKGSNDNTILLLHGTGGDEHDLLQIGKTIDPNANLLSVRGEVNENGQNRFFRRLAVGVLDEQDLKKQSEKLYAFIKEASKNYAFNLDKLSVFGYSNGANIAISLMFMYEKCFKTALLAHPMMPYQRFTIPFQIKSNIFISAGLNDPLVPLDMTQTLMDTFKEKQALVKTHFGNEGHRFSIEALNLMIDFYHEHA
ncbi:MAG: alpha/beta hydrolase [Acholeplasma sp.]|nr:alpha/beta hydrolase [Acholeplasma sp.]